MARRSIDITWILTILVGAFLLLDGIAGVTHSSSFLGQIGRALAVRSTTLELVIAIIELVAGALLLVGVFLSLGELDRILGIAIFVAWLVIIVLRFFVRDFSPDALAWWIGVVEYAIILAVIWMVTKRRA